MMLSVMLPTGGTLTEVAAERKVINLVGRYAVFHLLYVLEVAEFVVDALLRIRNLLNSAFVLVAHISLRYPHAPRAVPPCPHQHIADTGQSMLTPRPKAHVKLKYYFFQLAGSLRHSCSSSTSASEIYPVSNSLSHNVLIVGKSYQLYAGILERLLCNGEIRKCKMQPYLPPRRLPGAEPQQP